MATTEGLRAERLARVNDTIQGSGYNPDRNRAGDGCVEGGGIALDDRGKLPDQR